MLNRSTYMRREIRLGSLMQIRKNKYILPLAIKGIPGCFSFKLDNSFNSSSPQISSICTQKLLPTETLVSRIINNCFLQIGRRYYNKRKFTHSQMATTQGIWDPTVVMLLCLWGYSTCYDLHLITLLFAFCSSYLFPKAINFFFLHSIAKSHPVYGKKKKNYVYS